MYRWIEKTDKEREFVYIFMQGFMICQSKTRSFLFSISVLVVTVTMYS